MARDPGVELCSLTPNDFCGVAGDSHWVPDGWRPVGTEPRTGLFLSGSCLSQGKRRDAEQSNPERERSPAGLRGTITPDYASWEFFEKNEDGGSHRSRKSGGSTECVLGVQGNPQTAQGLSGILPRGTRGYPRACPDESRPPRPPLTFSSGPPASTRADGRSRVINILPDQTA